MFQISLVLPANWHATIIGSRTFLFKAGNMILGEIAVQPAVPMVHGLEWLNVDKK